MREGVREIVEGYFDARINRIARMTYTALVQADRTVRFERIAKHVRRDFYHFYSIASEVDAVFGKDRCEVERANAIFGVLEEHAALLYSKDIKMTVH